MPGSVNGDQAAADVQAARYGSDLRALLGSLDRRGAGPCRLPRWTSVDSPGWKLGGPLGLACERCTRQLQWADWWHAGAARMRNNAFVFCPEHGGPVTHHRDKKLQLLIWARQQLDSSVHPTSKSPSRYEVYAFDVLGLGRPSVYVGETAKSVEERYAEHGRGVRSPRIIRGGRGEVGPLRPDLVADLPALTSKTAALSAQHWVHASLQHRGFAVYGDGRR